ncbi:DUF1294 domain-containing protein [Budviciaceae bacterium BWR-B9]|uniref:DUF1294 domain-containing protein n=1 Tax=Limnobaculum allomyrinae TaxID=2791986 RepID=A0ABS1IW89_9GAMM|nr:MULTISPECIES: DUF1294 domain-containing protein [Limnobaculum]MBK5145495.1 DUF1294 domain-containing protein [Limnobaculum allomyrinae]MBV7693614.1 DUF1294 domain-containing protein [Limnobaculum sp. M2-1]
MKSRTDTNKKYRTSSLTTLLVIILFISAIALAFWFGWLPLPVVILYATLSLITFLFYGKDKSAAKNHTWRIKESTLLWLGVIGGWPGALMAQQLFRHKSSKKSFQWMFWITVAINSAILIWWLRNR